MNVTLKPEHQQFIEDQIRTGRFGSAEDAVAAAVALLIQEEEEDEEFDAADLAAIQEGLDQADRGEGYTLEELTERLRARGIDIR